MTDDTEKWKSPNGHAIASGETDMFQRIIDEHNTNDLLAAAVELIKFYADVEEARWGEPCKRLRDFLAKIEM
ncbi:hypothetical protein [Caudoviricetes sp.]|nr:hypothetical protein [Caudoviricetes sp.]